MRRYLLAVAMLSLAACSTSRHAGEGIGYTPNHLTRQLPVPAPDSEPTPPHAEPRAKPSFFHQLFPGKQPAPAAQASDWVTPASGHASQVPKKCKGCTFNLVAGNQTNAGKKAQVAAGAGAVASVTGKKSGPAVIASDSSTLNAVAGGGNLAAVQGDGNTTTLTKQDTTKEAPGLLATIANNATAWLPWVLGGLAVAGIGYGIYYFWFLIPRRKSAANQA